MFYPLNMVKFHNFFFVYTFCRSFDFSQKSNMTLQDCPNTQSDHSVTQKISPCCLFWKLSKNFGFQRNQCKRRYFTEVWFRTDALFFLTKSIYFIFKKHTLHIFIRINLAKAIQMNTHSVYCFQKYGTLSFSYYQ